MNQPNFDNLRSQLLTSGLQQANPSLYQVIDCLIKAIQQFQGITVDDISNINEVINNVTQDISNLDSKGTLGLLLDSNNDNDSDNFIPGPKGNDGINGLNGNNGIPSIDGEDGVDGINGINGVNGLNGTNGYNGIDGENGEDGLTIVGPMGQVGPIGLSGINGLDGIDGTDGIDGFSIKGETGATGTAGANGTNGLNGINGMDGMDGEDAAYYLLGQIGVSTSSSSGLTQPQVCVLVSLRG